MTEIIATIILWSITTLIFVLISIRAIKKGKEKTYRIDYYPVVIGLAVWEAIFTVMCAAVIVAYAGL